MKPLSKNEKSMNLVIVTELYNGTILKHPKDIKGARVRWVPGNLDSRCMSYEGHQARMIASSPEGYKAIYSINLIGNIWVAVFDIDTELGIAYCILNKRNELPVVTHISLLEIIDILSNRECPGKQQRELLDRVVNAVKDTEYYRDYLEFHNLQESMMLMQGTDLSDSLSYNVRDNELVNITSSAIDSNGNSMEILLLTASLLHKDNCMMDLTNITHSAVRYIIKGFNGAHLSVRAGKRFDGNIPINFLGKDLGFISVHADEASIPSLLNISEELTSKLVSKLIYHIYEGNFKCLIAAFVRDSVLTDKEFRLHDVGDGRKPYNEVRVSTLSTPAKGNILKFSRNGKSIELNANLNLGSLIDEYTEDKLKYSKLNRNSTLAFEASMLRQKFMGSLTEKQLLFDLLEEAFTNLIDRLL